MEYTTFKTLSDFGSGSSWQKLYRNARGEVGYWQHDVAAYVWFEYNTTRDQWELCGSTYTLGGAKRLRKADVRANS